MLLPKSETTNPHRDYLYALREINKKKETEEAKKQLFRGTPVTTEMS